MNWFSIRTPLCQADIESLEEALDVRLPEDYKCQIGPINGGALKNACIRLPQLGDVPYSRNVPLHKEACAGIFDLLPILNGSTPTLFPFASVGNGDYFCFDLEADCVVVYLHETLTTQYVCQTFTELLDSLITE